MLNEDFGFISISDMGDLPDSYATCLDVDGPRHILGSAFLGSSLPDTDPNGQPGTTATGDDTDGNNDEDGVARDLTHHWDPGANVDIQVTVGGNPGYLAAWFDWDNSGVFDTGELVDFGGLAVGTHTLQVSVPGDGSYSTGNPLNARFRLYESDPMTVTPNGFTSGGEVEDYHWVFSPTAVQITHLSARTRIEYRETPARAGWSVDLAPGRGGHVDCYFSLRAMASACPFKPSERAMTSAAGPMA